MPLLNHHEASLSFPPPKLDASSSSPLFPLSPLIFDHDLFNDITLILAPPPQISPSSPPPPPLRPSPPDKPSSTHRNTNPSPRSAAALMCDLDKYCGTRRAKRVDGGGAVGRRLIRKDRHSKIHTAQGPRDRRMRLSLDVARKFFDLQDTLGFDKASKTVDWLLSCCKSSIMELTGSSSARRRHPAVLDAVGNAKSESSTSSECEVISVSTNHAPPAARAKRAAVRRRPRDAPAAHPPPSREKRQMARARARERTKKNKMLRLRQCEGGGGGQRSKQTPASSTGEDSAGTGTHTTKNSCRDLLIAEEGQLITTCSPDQCKNCPGAASQPAVAIAGGSSAPISILDYSQNIVRNGDDISFVEKHHSWDMISPSGSAEEQRVLSFADHAQLQLFLWEAFHT